MSRGIERTENSTMKKLLTLFIMCFALTACQACGPAELKTDEDTSKEELYAWATWEECSQSEGDHPCNFTLKDQHGDDVSLYDFYGSPIILDFSAMWCGPCNMAAIELQETVDKYKDDDLRYITVLIDNSQGDPPTQEELARWATDYGISEPVLGGNRDMLNGDASLGWPLGSWPTFVGITSEMEIHLVMTGFSSSLIEYLADETIAASQ